MSKIKQIKAREILDSRGNPTVEAEVILENGMKAVAKTPSGASTGKYEAWELRDSDKNRYGGKGVLSVLKNVVEKISPVLVVIEVTKQRKIDEMMIKLDGGYIEGGVEIGSIRAIIEKYEDSETEYDEALLQFRGGTALDTKSKLTYLGYML
jgi:enolase